MTHCGSCDGDGVTAGGGCRRNMTQCGVIDGVVALNLSQFPTVLMLSRDRHDSYYNSGIIWWGRSA